MTDGDHDVGVLDRPEPLQLGLQLHGGRRQAEESELALGVGDLHLLRGAGVQGHGDARQGGALLVEDLAVEVAGLQLGEGGTAGDQ